MPRAARNKPATHRPAAMYGITRGVGSDYWKVAIQRNGVAFSKSFSFSVQGGEKAALMRAQAWRDEMVKAHPPASRRQRAQTLRRNSTSGLTGVTCTLGPDGKPTAWIAKTHLAPGKILGKYFSVGRYGADAKPLAIAEREKQLQQMVGLSIPHPAEAVLRKAPRRRERLDGPSPTSRSELIRSTNKSGISGVQLRHQSGRQNDQGQWVAQTYIGNGEARLRSFAISKYGEKQAKALAIAERARQLELKREIQSAQLNSTRGAARRKRPAMSS